MDTRHRTRSNHEILPQIYTGSSREELVTIETDAWKRGYERAVADGAAVMRELAQVERASEAACNEALLVYCPMELNRFRDVFTLAWCGGYWTHVQEARMVVE